MFLRFCGAALVAGLFTMSTTTQSATAQTVRFDTNVGTFDLELNPTGNPNLQGHVDNMLSYVESGRYDLTVINRATEGFVMQMGGFQLGEFFLPSAFSTFAEVSKDAPVIVDADNDGAVDFDLAGLDNTRGTVSLALSNSANTGTSSFFVNLGTNPSLDAANLRFVPFAKISDMATIDLIMGLEQANLSDGGLAADDIPLLDANRLVFVERAFVLSSVLEAAGEMMEEELGGGQESLSNFASALSSDSPITMSVPEPAALMLAVFGGMAILAMKPRRS